MSKIALALIAITAAVTALLLLLFGWRRVHVAPERARTLRGRYLLAVAFFLALFAGYVDRLTAADAPPVGQTQQKLSLPELQKAVTAVLTHQAPAGNDWTDPDIHPNVLDLLEKSGVITAAPRVRCYDRVAVPIKERSEELAALQKSLLDEKVQAGVIPGEVAAKITAIPDPRPGTPADARAYQLKVRRIARFLYAAGELDGRTLKNLEQAIGIPIADIDQVALLRTDIGYAIQGCIPFDWPGGARRELLAVLAKHEVTTIPNTHRGEFNRGNVENARTTFAALAKALADPKDVVTLPQDKDAKPVTFPNEPADLRAYRLKARHALRLLLAHGIVEQHRVKALESALGLPLFGPVADEPVHRGLDNL